MKIHTELLVIVCFGVSRCIQKGKKAKHMQFKRQQITQKRNILTSN